MIGFSNVQLALLLAVEISFGALLGAVPGLLLAVLLRTVAPNRIVDARDWRLWNFCRPRSQRVGRIARHVRCRFSRIPGRAWLVLAICLTVAVVSARHARLRTRAHCSVGAWAELSFWNFLRRVADVLMRGSQLRSSTRDSEVPPFLEVSDHQFGRSERLALCCRFAPPNMPLQQTNAPSII